jgi:hypothetical protein
MSAYAPKRPLPREQQRILDEARAKVDAQRRESKVLCAGCRKPMLVRVPSPARFRHAHERCAGKVVK